MQKSISKETHFYRLKITSKISRSHFWNISKFLRGLPPKDVSKPEHRDPPRLAETRMKSAVSRRDPPRLAENPPEKRRDPPRSAETRRDRRRSAEIRRDPPRLAETGEKRRDPPRSAETRRDSFREFSLRNFNLIIANKFPMMLESELLFRGLWTQNPFSRFMDSDLCFSPGRIEARRSVSGSMECDWLRACVVSW